MNYQNQEAPKTNLTMDSTIATYESYQLHKQQQQQYTSNANSDNASTAAQLASYNYYHPTKKTTQALNSNYRGGRDVQEEERGDVSTLRHSVTMPAKLLSSTHPSINHNQQSQSVRFASSVDYTNMNKNAYNNTSNNGGGYNQQQFAIQREINKSMSSTINTLDDYTIGLNSYATPGQQQKYAPSLQKIMNKEIKKVYPPIKLSQKTTTLSNKLVSPIKSKVKMVQPGRLFVRMPVKNEEEELLFSLGEFSIGIKLTDIDGNIIQKAKKKIERRSEKEARKNGVYGGVGGLTTTMNEGSSGNNKGRELAKEEEEEGEEEVPKFASLRVTHTPHSTSSTPHLSSSSKTTTPPTTTSETATTTERRTIWSSTPGKNFIGATSLSSLSITSSGNMNEVYSRLYSIQTIDDIQYQSVKPAVNNDGNGRGKVVVISGQLSHTISENGELPVDSPNYTLTFELVGKEEGLKFSLYVEGGEVIYKDGRTSGNREGSIDGASAREGKVEYDYTVNSAHLFFQSTEESSYFGLGARLSKPNLKGLEVQVCHPTSITSSSSNCSGSSTNEEGNHQYYSPKNKSNSSTIPHFINPQTNVSCHLHNVEPSIFDFQTSANWYSIRTVCNVLVGTFLVGTSPLDLCTKYTSNSNVLNGGSGRSKLLPKWVVGNGILVGLHGGTHAVQDVMKSLYRHKTNVAGVLIKDWTGTKSSSGGGVGSSPRSSKGKGGKGKTIQDTSITNCNVGKTNGSNTSYYNYVLERETYPQYQPFVDSLERRGISVGLYLSPYLEEIPMHLRSGRRYLFGEVEGDYFVKKQVVNGKSGSIGSRLSIKNKGNSKKDTQEVTMYNQFKKNKCGILDPTNYNATSWYKKVVKEEVFDYASASFWLADMTMGGPPLDGLYTSTPIEASSPSSGLSSHNSYAEQWAKVNQDAIKEAGRDGDSFFIVNAAYGATAKYAGATSLGDHVANFHNEDSSGSVLQSIVNGIVNGGMSGLTHGHCAVNMAVPRQLSNALGTSIDAKSRELICRWFEISAFTTLFRTHDGNANINDEKNKNGDMLSAYDDEVVMKSLARNSQVYVALAAYRLQLLSEASFKGYPVVRHPLLHFPKDEHFIGSSTSSSRGSGRKKKIDEEVAASSLSAFMMGNLIYVVPVLKSGVVKSRVYLPEGGWIHLWSGEQVAGPCSIGKTVEVSSPIGEPPVFIRDCDVMNQFVNILKQNGIISSKKRGESKLSLFPSFRRRK